MVKFVSLILGFLMLGANAFAQESGPFKVGVILPLTGPVAEYGVATKNGIELAKKEHSELFANVQFIYEDSQYDGKLALSAYQKLKNVDGASLAYIWGFGPNQAVVPVAETEKFPVIAVSAERSVSHNKAYTLRFCYPIDFISDTLLKHLRSQNIKRMGIVNTDIAYTNGLIDVMKANLRSGESIEVVDVHQPSDIDFKNTIAKLRNKKFDAIGVFLMTGQISKFYRQSAQLNLKMKTFGTDFFDSRKEVQDAVGTMAGAVFAAPYAAPDFVERYINAYGNDLQVTWGPNGYEFALLTARLFGEKREKVSSEEILERYTRSKEEQGETTTFQYNESPQGSGFDFKVVARRVEGDGIVNVAD